MRQRQPVHSDYLANEKGTHKKKWKGLLPVALIFPNGYALGNANLGFQLVYDLVNVLPDVVCERFFYDPSGPPLSLESGRPLRDFPVILCSVSFEPDYINLLSILLSGGIEPLAERRCARPSAYRAGQPLIIGGGVATFINPEPLAPFMDLFVVGEAEPVLGQLVAYLSENIHAVASGALLGDIVASFPGCYAPCFYKMRYGVGARLDGIDVSPGIPERVRRLTLKEVEVAGHSRLISSETEFANMYLAELGRGCSRGCRFCAAGFVYRPPRLWSAESILAALEKRPAEISRIGLLGMEMAKAEDLKRISDYLSSEGCALSFSSLRADAISSELCALLARSNLKSAAIAPDGGSERLRAVINKGIKEDDVMLAAEALVRAGVTHLKLYFMIGLPTESDEDIDELLSLVDKVRINLLAVGRAKGRLSNITLSVNSFVPKAWTPFQFHPFAKVSLLKDRIKRLRKGLSGMANIRLKADQPAIALQQAVLARGDRRVGLALHAMLARQMSWQQAMREQGINAEEVALRQRDRDELFCWEVIDHGIERGYLWTEYEKALHGKSTIACNPANCKRCGVCID